MALPRLYPLLLLPLIAPAAPSSLTDTRSCSNTDRELRERGLGGTAGVRAPISGKVSPLCVCAEFFLALLDAAEHSLNSMFVLSYGRLYSQNAALFSTLFSELRAYYMGGGASRVADALSEFWAGLLERTLRLLLPQYQLGADYMECAARRAEELRPFGDSPRRLRLQITRALGAARTLVEGLGTGSDIVSGAAKAAPPPDCLRAVMRMWYCPLCRGHTNLHPCHGLCLNVLKGCLAYQADMDDDWNSLIDGLQEVAERLAGSFNIELAMESIAVKISEAIMSLQEESVQLTAQIFQTCGTPPPARSRRSPGEDPRQRFRAYNNDEKPTSADGTNIDRLVSEIVGKLRPLRGLWKLLPRSLCSDNRVSAGLSNQEKCWNGQNRGRYLPQVAGDGLINQINNPEVELQMSPADPRTRSLGPQLRLARMKLRAAYSGHDSDTQDVYDDDGSGGSGDGDIATDKPVTRTVAGGTQRKDRPGKNKKQNNSGGGRGGKRGGSGFSSAEGPITPSGLALTLTLLLGALIRV
eukprot:XP_017944946.1 PREDICTED: glypican-2 [Xenopus tropicalis]